MSLKRVVLPIIVVTLPIVYAEPAVSLPSWFFADYAQGEVVETDCPDAPIGVGGCNECVANSIDGICTPRQPDCPLLLSECVVCDMPCGSRIFAKKYENSTDRFERRFLVDNTEAFRTVLDNCNHWTSTVPCQHESLGYDIYGAYREGVMLIGTGDPLPGSPFDSFWDLRTDAHWHSTVASLTELTPDVEYKWNEEKAWRQRVGAFWEAVESYPPGRNLGHFKSYYERAAHLVTWFYFYEFGPFYQDLSATDLGYPSGNPLSDQYNFDQLEAIETTTCRDPFFDDCEVIDIEGNSWGRTKARYRG